MITVGTKVAILPGSDYANRFVGQVGIVRKNYKDKIGVQIDGCRNPESEYGLFWFGEKWLAVIPNFSSNVDDAIKQIIYSGQKTIILWADGTKPIVSCGMEDDFDPYAGFCAAVAKKLFGSTSKVKKIINRHARENR